MPDAFSFLPTARLLFVCGDPATSNAPQKGRKRRLSSTEREQDPDLEESSKKKIRGESTASSVPDVNDQQLPQVETEEVKEVTEGVKEVELADSEQVVGPASVPLPEDDSGELDERSSATPPPETQQLKTEALVGESASSVSEDTTEPNTATTVSAEDVALPEGGKEEEDVLAVAGDTTTAAPVQDDVESETTENVQRTKDDTPHIKD